jgi:hypothetical protein
MFRPAALHELQDHEHIGARALPPPAAGLFAISTGLENQSEAQHRYRKTLPRASPARVVSDGCRRPLEQRRSS